MSRLIPLLTILLAGPLYAQSLARPLHDARVEVVRSDDRGVVLRVTAFRPLLRDGVRGISVTHNVPLGVAFADTATVPGVRFRVAIPGDATNLNVHYRADGTERLPGDFAHFRAGPPRAFVGGDAWVRRLRTVQVTAWPMRTDGSGLAVDTAFTISLTWTGAADKWVSRAGVPESPSVAGALSSLIVNYQQAAGWRQSGSRAAEGALATAGGGWGMGEAIVLATPRDGLYRISASELVASGATGLNGISLSQLALTNRGEPVPLYVRDADGNGAFSGDDFVEFSARRVWSSEGFYYDEVTDTNAYVLSWDGRVASPRLSDASFGPSVPPLVSYDSTLHFEHELIPHLGFSWPDSLGGETSTVHVPEFVDGEGLYWRWYRQAPFGDDVSFDASPAFTLNGVYTLRARFANRTVVPVELRLYMNEYQELGVVTLPARNDTVVSLSVPAHYLINGRNSLRISAGPMDVIEVGLDWIELTGSWLPSTFTASARLALPDNAAPASPFRLRLTGLYAPVSIVHTPTERIVVDSAGSRGTLVRLSARQFFEGGLRINRGFVAETGSGRIASEPWALGLMLIELTPQGSVVRSEYFRTFDNASEFDRAAQFIRSVASLNIVAGGTAVGFGIRTIPAGLATELERLGSTVTNRSDLFYAAWAFAARKDAPSTVREAFEPMSGAASRGVTLDAFIPVAAGNDLMAAMSVAGSPGDEIIIGEPIRPGLRYHSGDRLVAAENRADLIIITHPDFRGSADRLAAHRRLHAPSGDTSFAVRVVDVLDVYDEFNHGVKHPIAIRRFLQYADSNWTEPSPAYVLLFGDASFDPQRRLENAQMIDFVPTYGEPASDYLFTVPFNGADPDSPKWSRDTSSSFNQYIGRLPAMTAVDGEAMVDKIIDYDTTAPARWHKRAVFIAGGANQEEVANNRGVAESLADYIMAPWFHGDTVITYRRTISSFPAVPPHPDAVWAQREMAAGALWVNSAGHGSRTILDLDFGMPGSIDNGNRYFVLSTFSCQTGAFSDQQQSLRNEDFVKAPGRGAIAAFGSTGWSYADINASIQRNLFDQLTRVYRTNLGELTTYAKWLEFAPYAEGWPDQPYADGFRRRNHLLSYSLLGDPSMDLRPSRFREFAFESPTFASPGGGAPSVADSIAILRVELWNYGRPMFFTDPDSVVTVVATIVNRQREERSDTVEVHWLQRFAPIEFELPIDRTPGEYTVRIEADPERRIEEGYRDDNVLVRVLRVRGNEPLPLEPLPFGRVDSYDDIYIRLLNPPSGPGAEIVVDTTDAFDAGSSFSSASTGIMTSDELTTTWRFSIPQSLRGARQFWWRATATSGDPEIARMFPLIESFTVEATSRGAFIQEGERQLAESDLGGLVFSKGGVGPGSRSVPVRVRAIGQSKYPGGTEIEVAKVSIVLDPGTPRARELAQAYQRPGIQVMLLDNSTLDVLAYRHFLLYMMPDQVDGFISFLDSLPAGHPVIIATNGRSFDDLVSSPRRAEMIAALTLVGSTVAERLGAEDSYALLGGKGIPLRGEAWIGGDSLEGVRSQPPGYAEVTVSSVMSAVPRPGALTTPVIGPALRWQSATISHPEGTARPDVAVLGVRRDGRRDSLAIWRTPQRIDLSEISAAEYPRLELRSIFALDSTMRVSGVTVEFEPSPELAILPQSIAMDTDSVMQGDPAELSVTVVNLSRTRRADSVAARVSLAGASGARVVGDQLTSLDPLTRGVLRYPILTDQLTGTSRFTFALNPEDLPSEPYRINNADSVTLRVSQDAATPSVQLYADGSRVIDGDYVSPTARFELRLLDNSLLTITDSTSIRMFLDLEEITRDSGATFQMFDDGTHRASFIYTPPAPGLADGEHTITYQATDASGNKTTSEYVSFRVERGLRLDRVVNYPNPFSDQTEFTFMIIGDRAPVHGSIALFTVAGRKIRSIELGPTEVHLGFNRVKWDGRDADGDRLANGVYLYRLSVENDDGTLAETIEKAVVMR